MTDLSSNAPAVERGVGFFETMLVVGDRVCLFAEHVTRLRRTLAGLELPAPSERELGLAAAHALELHRERENAQAALRLTWLAVSNQLDAAESWRLDASVRAIPATTLRRRLGCHAVTLPATFQRDSPGLKSTSYLSAVLGLRRAQRQGADEGLFVAPDGSFLEGTSVALAAWDGERLLRPARGALPSVTAAAFEQSVGAASQRRCLERPDLLAGAVVLGALTLAAPLLSLDGEACRQPPGLCERAQAFNRRLVDSARPIPELLDLNRR